MEFRRINVTDKNMLHVCREIIRTEPLLSLLRKRADMRVLDLGCQLPVLLWLMYHIYHCKSLIGVDLHSEHGIMLASANRQAPEHYESYRKLKSLFEWYRAIIRPDADEPALIEGKNEYERKFKICYETKIEDFLSTTRLKFDFVNASNVLHFIKDQTILEKTMRHIKRVLKSDGLLFIRIQIGEGREYFDYERYVELLKELFPSGVLSEYREEGKEIATFRNFDLP